MNIAERSREGARDYLRLAENVGYGADNALRTAALEVRRLLRSDARTLLASSS